MNLPFASSADQAALDTGALVRSLAPGEAGALRLQGPDAVSFLHRMTTSHVEGLAVGASQPTCFPDKRGRLVAAAVLHRTADDAVSVLGRLDVDALASWIDQFLFAEELEVRRGPAAGLDLIGARALDVAEALLPGSGALGPWAAIGGAAMGVVRWFDVRAPSGAAVPRVALLTDAAPAELLALAVDAGAHVGERAVFEAARIAAGAPDAPAELGDRHNALELALHDALHWDKGCYIGQEVIARIDNYGKQARHLVALELDDRTLALATGAKVLAEDQEVGRVTSAAPLDLGTGPTALALLRGDARLEGRVHVELANGATTPATVRGRAAAQLPHD